jgi:hypothetical protein
LPRGNYAILDASQAVLLLLAAGIFAAVHLGWMS